MNYTISMTDILLAVSVGCNLWFLFLLLYERIMDTRIVRFFKGIVGLWRSLDGNEAKRIAAHEEVPAEKADIIGKSRFRMASTRTTAAIPTQEAATIEKGIELSEEEATFDDGKTGNASRPAQVPEEKLDETFTSIPPEELGYGDDEPEEDASDTPRASGSSFDEIDDACKTAKNPDATQAEREKAAKVFTDMEKIIQSWLRKRWQVYGCLQWRQALPVSRCLIAYHSASIRRTLELYRGSKTGELNL